MLMRKTLLILSIMALMAAPMLAAELFLDPEVAVQADSRITIEVKGNSVIISGAQGMEFEVISLTGRQLYKRLIETPVERIDLNLSRGCYIIKVGDIARKVSIR